MTAERFRCYLVEKSDDGVRAAVAERPRADLPEGDVTVRVAYSSLNYKDALAASGNPGVVRTFPHVPGIDAAGVVVESRAAGFTEGDQVLVTGYGLGAIRWGGFAEYVRVPAEWVVPLPESLSLRESMMIGTAGFTAALSVDNLLAHGVEPSRGDVLVTGASGGVGVAATAILAKAGFRVIASTGKPAAHAMLADLGAAEVIDRSQVHDASGRPLLSARWAAAVDTVGGATLATVLRATERAGCVTACGNVGGAELPITVFPFILRGVALLGIDSAECPIERRRRLWSRLADDWRLPGLEPYTRCVDLAGLPAEIQNILRGAVAGRVIVDLQATTDA